jgi:hypothetical protein
MSIKPRDGASVTRDGSAPEDRRVAAAKECVAVALDSIEEAQRFIDLAGQALCGVRGLAPEWRKVGALYDRVKRTWYTVRDKAGRLSRQGRLILDHHPSFDEGSATAHRAAGE